MILGEVIQRVQSLYSKGVHSDDSRLSSRHIYNKLITVRSKLITQKRNKNQFVAQSNFQTISCVDMIVAPVYECPCIPPVGCTIYRTKNVIPDIIASNKKHLIQSITSLDGTVVFSEITWTEKKYKNGTKYTAKSPDYFIRNGYIYITTDKPGKVISVTALFENPILATVFDNCCNQYDACTSYLDMDFPMDGNMIDTMIEMSTQELIEVFNKNIEDLRNDSKDSPNESSK